MKIGAALPSKSGCKLLSLERSPVHLEPTLVPPQTAQNAASLSEKCTDLHPPPPYPLLRQRTETMLAGVAGSPLKKLGFKKTEPPVITKQEPVRRPCPVAAPPPYNLHFRFDDNGVPVNRRAFLCPEDEEGRSSRQW